MREKCSHRARCPKVGSFRYLARDDRWEWSDEVAAMHGYAPGTVTPTTELVLSHKHPDDKATVAEVIEQVRSDGVAFSSRHRIIDTQGGVHLVVVVGDKVHDADGFAIGTAGFYVDVTAEFNADVQNSITEAVVAINERRAVINQAVGILMLCHGTSSEVAFAVLAAESQRTNVKLRTVAERFVDAATAEGGLPTEAAAHMDALLRRAGGDISPATWRAGSARTSGGTARRIGRCG